MHVDHASAGELEHLGAEDVTVRHYDTEVGLEAPKAGRKDITDWTDRLKYRYSCRERGDLDWWGDQLGARPSLRLIGLGNDTCDREPPMQQCL
jgi:hypothetical protein